MDKDKEKNFDLPDKDKKEEEDQELFPLDDLFDKDEDEEEDEEDSEEEYEDEDEEEDEEGRFYIPQMTIQISGVPLEPSSFFQGASQFEAMLRKLGLIEDKQPMNGRDQAFSDQRQSLKRQRFSLMQQLDEAMEREDYEKCAEYRDGIEKVSDELVRLNEERKDPYGV